MLGKLRASLTPPTACPPPPWTTPSVVHTPLDKPRPIPRRSSRPFAPRFAHSIHRGDDDEPILILFLGAGEGYWHSNCCCWMVSMFVGVTYQHSNGGAGGDRSGELH